MIVTKSTEPSVEVALDPIYAQLAIDSDLSGELGLGMIKANLFGIAQLEGSATLSYCPDPCTADVTGLTQVSSSPFYYQSSVGYDLNGGIEISCKSFVVP